MHEMRLYYNLAEANALIPTLEYQFSELARIQQQVNSLCEKASEVGVKIDPNDVLGLRRVDSFSIPSLRDNIKALSEEYMARIDEIRNLGVVICDINHGIIGFHSWLAGHDILLSWQYGEPQVQYWHRVSELAETRRSLAEFLPHDVRPAPLH
jgi:hypothetical protein